MQFLHPANDHNNEISFSQTSNFTSQLRVIFGNCGVPKILQVGTLLVGIEA